MDVGRESRIEVYFRVVEAIATLSHANRGKVAAVLVKDGRIISTGYNGMPTGLDNDCEYKRIEDIANSGRTKSEVIHAEINAILFAARHGQATEDTVMYSSFSPCIECAKAIVQAGIKEVHYLYVYITDNGKGLNLLSKVGIKHKHYVRSKQV